jgi:hypothetical protein
MTFPEFRAATARADAEEEAAAGGDTGDGDDARRHYLQTTLVEGVAPSAAACV